MNVSKNMQVRYELRITIFISQAVSYYREWDELNELNTTRAKIK